MFGNDSHFARVLAAFADQFEPDGADFLYRRSLRGPAYRVSTVERDTFVADFNRSFRRLFWIMLGGTVAVIAVFVVICVRIDIEPDDVSPLVIAGIVALLLAPLYVAVCHIHSAPARALEQRAPVSAALSNDARHNLALGRLTWGRLAAGTAMFLFLPITASGWHPLDARNRPWVAVGAMGLVLCAVQAFRKWRFERRG